MVAHREGKQAYEKWTDPEEFILGSISLYRAWKKARPLDETGTEGPAGETPGAASTLEEAEESAWSEIEQYLRAINPYDLQELVAALLGAMGYHVSWIAPAGPDGGLDVTAYTDALESQGPRIKVQVKRRQDKMNVHESRSLLGLLGDHDVGLFVSTGGFTPDAERLVREQERRRVTLEDLGKLFDLWVEHYDRIEENEEEAPPSEGGPLPRPDQVAPDWRSDEFRSKPNLRIQLGPRARRGHRPAGNEGASQP